jgi:glucose-6-phosphate dehydrogenase assembly protein OpcA
VSALNVEELLGALEHERRDRGGICTTSLNVIAFVENDEALLHWLEESSDAFAEAHGFRILLLDASAPSTAYSVRTHCKEFNDTLLTSLEQLQIGVKDVGAEELRSVVHDLLHPSVRNVLWWGGQHLKDDRFAQLAQLAQTIILFTSRHDSLQALRELVQLADSETVEHIRDLAYLRLVAWQDMVAQFFDDAELAAELPRLTRVDVTAGSEPEAYYLAAWLASRLSWAPCGELDFCNSAGKPIRVDFHKEGPPRRIRGIKLQTPSYTFGISVSPEADDLVCLTVDGAKDRPVQCVPLHDVDIISLVQRAIFAPSDGGVYLQTLGVLRRILEWERRS